MFADLPSHFLLEPACVDKGEYIDHGTFGDIYHGSVYPSVTATVSTGVILLIFVRLLSVLLQQYMYAEKALEGLRSGYCP